MNLNSVFSGRSFDKDVCVIRPTTSSSSSNVRSTNSVGFSLFDNFTPPWKLPGKLELPGPALGFERLNKISGVRHDEDTGMLDFVEGNKESSVLTYDDEITLLMSYCNGNKYQTKDNKIIEVLDRELYQVEYRGFYTNNQGDSCSYVAKLERFKFLAMMGFKDGSETQR